PDEVGAWRRAVEPQRDFDAAALEEAAAEAAQQINAKAKNGNDGEHLRHARGSVGKRVPRIGDTGADRCSSARVMPKLRDWGFGIGDWLDHERHAVSQSDHGSR